MKTIEEVLKDNEPKQIGDNPPKMMWLSDVKRMSKENFGISDALISYGSHSNWHIAKETTKEAIKSLAKIPSEVKMFMGETEMKLGGYFGDPVMITRGKVGVQAANRNLQAITAEMERDSKLNADDRKTFLSQAVNAGWTYAEMVLSGLVVGKAGKIAGLGKKGTDIMTDVGSMGAMSVMELGEETEEGAQRYIETTGDKDMKNITPDWAGKEVTSTVAYTSLVGLLEKYMGFGKQRKIFKNIPKSSFGVKDDMFERAVKEYSKTGLKTALSEGTTEFAQSLANIGVDIIDGTFDWTKMPQRFKGALLEGGMGAVVGGTAGMSMAISNRRAFKNDLTDYLKGTVPEENIDAIVDSVYESGINEISNVIATELELSSELRNKHGEIFDSMQAAIAKEVEHSGAYANYSEDKKAQYIHETAKLYADQVLAEANNRGVLIDEVMRGKDIVWDNGIKFLNNKERINEQKQELKAQIEENAPAEEKEQNLNDVVSSYEGAENFDVAAMPTEEKQAVFEAEQQVNDAFVPTQTEETTQETKPQEAEEAVIDREDGELFGKNEDLGEGKVTTEKEKAELAEKIKQEWKESEDAEENYSWRKLSDIENEYAKLYGEEELARLNDEYEEEQYDLRKDKERTEKYNDWKQAQAELSPETAEAMQEDTLPEVEESDVVKKEPKKSKKKAQKEQKGDKIEDFGEYLYGAKKDLWTGFKNKLSEPLPEDAVNIKLSEVFPEPNYEKAIADGVDVNALATIKALRDLIPTKPKYAYKLKQWRELVFTLRNIASSIVNNNFDTSVIDNVLKQEKFADINNIVKTYMMLGYPYFTKAKGYTVEPALYHEWKPGQWVLTNIWHEGDREGFAVTFNKRYVSVNGEYFVENINDAIDAVKEKIDNAANAEKKVKFDIWYNTSDPNTIYLGKKVRSGKYLEMHKFNSTKEAREYLKNNYDALVEELEKLKQNPMDRGEVNQARIGEDYRKGTDATPEIFADMFGFRGVQFGNWVEQQTRVKDLNEAYDALVDLAKVLGIPTRAISLNGTLGLAFGARGHKGAAAHYEPDKVVINLTKMNGAGSLAHEWFHALDNSFMKKDDKSLGYTSEMAFANNPLSHNRPEVMLAFYNLRNALEKSPLMERAEKWDLWRSKDYWSTIREMGARTFEQYVKDKLAEKGVENDFLANIFAVNGDNNVYLNEDEKAEIYEAYDKLFDTLQTRETDKGVELYQGGEDIAENLFKPTRIEKNNFINDLRNAEQNAGNEKKIIRLGKLPAVYEVIGIPPANLNTSKKVIIKDTIEKHDVSMNTVEDLPELIADPLIVFKALPDSMDPNAYVAVLDAKDKNGLQMIAAISPTNREGGYHFITSFYGKTALQNMVNKANKLGNIKYIKEKSQVSAGEIQSFPITLTGSISDNILQKSDVVNSKNDVLYQSAYVSMKNELEGEYLDADRFAGSGEGNAAHGWGNYALKDRETNKTHYYDWMSEDRVYYDGQEIDSDVDGAIKLAAEEFIFNGKNVEETKKAIRGKIKSAEYDIKKEEKYINDLAEAYGVSKNEIKLLREYKDLGDSFRELMLIDRNGAIKKDKELREKLSYNALEHSAYFNVAFDNLDTAKRHLNEAKEALDVDFNKIEVKKTGAQYEVDVPEDEYLLDEDKTFNKQSKIVRDAINKIALSMDRRLNETKLRNLTGDKPSGTNEENWKTYYAKRAWRAGKDFVIEEIHNNHDGDMEQELIKFINDLNIEDISDVRSFDDYTGREIYRELDNYYGSQKAASKMLEKYGIKGIKYDGERDGIGYVIFKGADAPIIQRLLQAKGKKQGVKGSFTPSKNLIQLFKDADASTLPHEFAHYWLNNMWNYVRSGAASEKYQNRWGIVADWLGIKPTQTRIYRAQQEQFARGYEAYLWRGELPNPIIKGAFDDYDKWLREVYNDINELNVELTDDAIRFFQSMTTGELPEPNVRAKTAETQETTPTQEETTQTAETEKAQETTTQSEGETQAENESVKQVKRDVETITRPNNPERVETNIKVGEKGKSAVYTRVMQRGEVALQNEYPELEYNKVNLKQQLERATDYVTSHLLDAREVVYGRKNPPKDILDTAIRIAYEEAMLAQGNIPEYLNALKTHSAVQTIRGQEISAERIGRDDISSPKYWFDKISYNRKTEVARKVLGRIDSIKENITGGSPVAVLNKLIQNKAKELQKLVLEAKTPEAQQKIMKKFAEQVKKQYGLNEIDDDTLYQKELITEKNASAELLAFMEDVFGTSVSQNEMAEVVSGLDNVTKSENMTEDATGNPSIQTLAMYDAQNKKVAALTPSSDLAIATSIVGRSMMLASIKSPVLNILSNAEMLVTEGLTNRLALLAQGKSVNNLVDSEVRNDYLRYGVQAYVASGYNISTTENMNFENLIRGERILTTQGEGKFKKFAQFMETGIFKYAMGMPDSVSKDLAFVDYVCLEASNAGKTKEKATEIFKDATLIEPKTKIGKEIRKRAMAYAHKATFTNDSIVSKFSLKLRDTVNTLTGDVRLGDQLMPFVKTPANVVAIGAEYSAGALYGLLHWKTILSDVKSGNLSDTSRNAIQYAVRNGLGAMLAAMLAYAFEPDDYVPEYEALTPSERNMYQAKNAVYNSVKIGNKYVSLDYFGPLGVPLAGMLSARREQAKGENAIKGYVAGAGYQAFTKTPGVKETKELYENTSRYLGQSADKTLADLWDASAQYVMSRTIPSIVNDMAKVLDDVERDTNRQIANVAKQKIPGLRNTLPERYNTLTGKPIPTESAASTLLFGSRVKTPADNAVIEEVSRLFGEGVRPALTDVTRYGKLKELDDDVKPEIRQKFAKLYSKAVADLIKTRSYQNANDDKKKRMIDKERRKATETIKQEYGIKRGR